MATDRKLTPLLVTKCPGRQSYTTGEFESECRQCYRRTVERSPMQVWMTPRDSPCDAWIPQPSDDFVD